MKNKLKRLRDAKTPADQDAIADEIFAELGGVDFKGINFDAYFDGSADGGADGGLFMLRCIQRFCERVSVNAPVEPWIMQSIAERFYVMLAGRGYHWSDEFHLPWIRPARHGQSRAEDQGLSMYFDIEAGLTANPTANKTYIIECVARDHEVSYETARDWYYKFSKNRRRV
jgi:hypothetical protein